MRIFHYWWSLIIPLVLYLVGALLIPHQDISQLERQNIAEQHIDTYIDRDGEEHESLSLIKIDGIGYIFSYKNLYLASLTMFVPLLVFGRLIFGEHQNELKTLVFGNCVIGCGLIGLTSSAHILSTIVFWAGIIVASFSIQLGDHKKY